MKTFYTTIAALVLVACDMALGAETAVAITGVQTLIRLQNAGFGVTTVVGDQIFLAPTNTINTICTGTHTNTGLSAAALLLRDVDAAAQRGEVKPLRFVIEPICTVSGGKPEGGEEQQPQQQQQQQQQRSTRPAASAK